MDTMKRICLEHLTPDGVHEVSGTKEQPCPIERIPQKFHDPGILLADVSLEEKVGCKTL